MIPICYSGNSKIFEGILMSLLSITKYCKDELDIILLTMDLTHKNPKFTPITSEQANLIEEIIRKTNEQSRVRIIDLTDIFSASNIISGKNKKISYTPYCLLRLFLDKLDGIPDKLLYLDMDIMALDDISILYSHDIAGYDFAAVLDHMGQIFIHPEYVNSGVMILNIPLMKQNDVFNKCREMIYKKWMILVDQTALNRHAKKILRLPRRFNEQRHPQSDTVLKHFCKGIKFFPIFKIYNIKQWQREKVHSFLKITEFDDIYEKFDQLKAEYNF